MSNALPPEPPRAEDPHREGLRAQDLRADCTACAGLCCVSAAFDADQGFGYDKPAREPCRHLEAGFRCAIHADRAAHGFTACAGYDCLGAGQRATRAFAPDDWRSAPGRAEAMHAAFLALRPLHELLSLLETARALVHEAEWQARLATQAEAVEGACRALLEAARSGGGSADAGPLRHSTFALLRELATVPSVRSRRPV